MGAVTLTAQLDQLGMTPSDSRPRMSEYNPLSEALFRTSKYYPPRTTRRTALLTFIRHETGSLALCVCTAMSIGTAACDTSRAA